jgi:NAD(P)-dependent dehydrogenase (short-subunit alcohol dehydrogenase family)
MDLQLAGKTALVSGSTAGIGYAIATRLATEGASDDDWETMFRVNVMSGVRLSRAYLPGMRDRNWGRIIFISSESAVHIPEEMIHYGMTKTAQIAIARGIAETTVGTGVTVNSVLAGPTMSEGVHEFVKQMADSQEKTIETVKDEFFQTARPTSLLQRFIEPEEVANLVAYVASPLSSATNGAPLRVEGGVVRAAL